MEPWHTGQRLALGDGVSFVFDGVFMKGQNRSKCRIAQTDSRKGCSLFAGTQMSACLLSSVLAVHACFSLVFASVPTAFPRKSLMPVPDTDEISMLYSIDLIAAGTLVVEHMLPVLMLFGALALVIVFID